MYMLKTQETKLVSGAGLEGCNINDMSKEFIKGAISGGLSGTAAGSVAVPGVGSIPGGFAGALSGGSPNSIIYGGTCWW